MPYGTSNADPLGILVTKEHIEFMIIFQRKETLLKEYETQFKVNTIVDKRFGEYDSSLTKDDKMMKRFAMERAVSFTNRYL